MRSRSTPSRAVLHPKPRRNRAAMASRFSTGRPAMRVTALPLRPAASTRMRNWAVVSAARGFGAATLGVSVPAGGVLGTTGNVANLANGECVNAPGEPVTTSFSLGTWEVSSESRLTASVRRSRPKDPSDARRNDLGPQDPGRLEGCRLAHPRLRQAFGAFGVWRSANSPSSRSFSRSGVLVGRGGASPATEPRTLAKPVQASRRSRLGSDQPRGSETPLGRVADLASGAAAGVLLDCCAEMQLALLRPEPWGGTGRHTEEMVSRRRLSEG
jgi:hypothetical protein